MFRLKSLTRSPADLEKAGHQEAAHGFKYFRALAPEKVANDKFMFCATYRKFNCISHFKTIIAINHPTYLSHSMDKLEQKRKNRGI